MKNAGTHFWTRNKCVVVVGARALRGQVLRALILYSCRYTGPGQRSLLRPPYPDCIAWHVDFKLPVFSLPRRLSPAEPYHAFAVTCSQVGFPYRCKVAMYCLKQLVAKMSVSRRVLMRSLRRKRSKPREKAKDTVGGAGEIHLGGKDKG